MATPLETFYRLAWDAFLDYGGWDGPDLQDAMVKAGLGEFRPATAAEAVGADYQEGDEILVPTISGLDALAATTKSDPMQPAA